MRGSGVRCFAALLWLLAACARPEPAAFTLRIAAPGGLSPLEPGLAGIFRRFKKVATVEINYSDAAGDPFITTENRRRGQLAWLLRAHTLVDVDCWTRVPGEPLRPGAILDGIMQMMNVDQEAAV